MARRRARGRPIGSTRRSAWRRRSFRTRSTCPPGRIRSFCARARPIGTSWFTRSPPNHEPDVDDGAFERSGLVVEGDRVGLLRRDHALEKRPYPLVPGGVKPLQAKLLALEL